MKWFLLLGAVLAVSAVDRAKFRRCIDTAFCRRHREDKSLTDYKIVSNSLKFNDTALHAILKNKENSLVLDIVALKDSTIRLVIDEFEGKEARVRTSKKSKSPRSAKKSRGLRRKMGIRLLCNINPSELIYTQREPSSQRLTQEIGYALSTSEREKDKRWRRILGGKMGRSQGYEAAWILLGKR
ncbi:unnamed protein product, partial [Mesorhabditis belari]|uniref:Uncharacterized protein n=1 Tax=Mesorhabditis belari TaxID=2138241 RepID=A0AAF3JC21_9BILA